MKLLLLAFLSFSCLVPVSTCAQIESLESQNVRKPLKTGFEKTPSGERATPFGIISFGLPNSEYNARDKSARAELEIGYVLFESQTSGLRPWTIRSQPFVRDEAATRSQQIYYARKLSEGLRFLFKQDSINREFFIEGLYSEPQERWDTGVDRESSFGLRLGLKIPFPLVDRPPARVHDKIAYRRTFTFIMNPVMGSPEQILSAEEARYLNALVVSMYVEEILKTHRKPPSPHRSELGAELLSGKIELPALVIYQLVSLETPLGLSKVDKALLLREPMPELDSIKNDERRLWRSSLAYSVLSRWLEAMLAHAYPLYLAFQPSGKIVRIEYRSDRPKQSRHTNHPYTVSEMVSDFLDYFITLENDSGPKALEK